MRGICYIHIWFTPSWRKTGWHLASGHLRHSTLCIFRSIHNSVLTGFPFCQWLFTLTSGWAGSRWVVRWEGALFHFESQRRREEAATHNSPAVLRPTVQWHTEKWLAWTSWGFKMKGNIFRNRCCVARLIITRLGKTASAESSLSNLLMIIISTSCNCYITCPNKMWEN